MTDPLLCTLPPGRHGLPREFVESNQRERLMTSFATEVNEKGYCAVTIADICAGASVSRRTFYEHFKSKESVADAWLRQTLAKSLHLDGVGVLAVEIICLCEVEGAAEAQARVATTTDIIEGLRVQLGSADDASQPPSAPPRSKGVEMLKKRPRLSKEFVRGHVRQRLIAGTSQVLCERGYTGARVSDIVSASRMARNTFYENFGSKDEASQAMVALVAPHLAEISLDTGLGITVIELIAKQQHEGPVALHQQMTVIESVMAMLMSHIDEMNEE